MRLTATAVLLTLLAPAAARGQPFDGTQTIDTYTGPLIASSRILGLGGAYVAVAEGLGGALVNPAAVAQRNARLARGWDWDWLLTWYVPDTGQVGRQDLGNDGGADVGLTGAGNGQLGLSFQWGRLGVAAFGGGWNLTAPRGGVGSVGMEIAEGSLAVGGSFRRETLVVGASFTTVSGVVRVVPATAGLPVAVEYSGSAIRLGALLRPRGSPWRLGAALRGEAVAKALGDRAAVPVATPGAVAIESALVPSAEARASGARASVVPRAGAEWEPAPDRFRVRGGTYVEPSRTGGSPRPHATFGIDVRVPFPWRDLQLGLSGDVAERFQNVSLSLGFWSTLGPAGPAPAAAPNPS